MNVNTNDMIQDINNAIKNGKQNRSIIVIQTPNATYLNTNGLYRLKMKKIMYTTAIIVLSAWGLTVITHDPAMDSW